jgi:hypothetical protein
MKGKVRFFLQDTMSLITAALAHFSTLNNVDSSCFQQTRRNSTTRINYFGGAVAHLKPHLLAKPPHAIGMQAPPALLACLAKFRTDKKNQEALLGLSGDAVPESVLFCDTMVKVNRHVLTKTQIPQCVPVLRFCCCILQAGCTPRAGYCCDGAQSL